MKAISSEIQTNKLYGQTAIVMRGNEEGGYFATLGNYLITHNHKEIDELEKTLNSPDIETIYNVVSILIETHLKIHEEENHHPVKANKETIENQ